ncbi:MAG TPA: glycoside hydrolase family 44 protein [Bryocella sp.]|nr:glycoside hydrolase family 44 protein [Bryocella sp.]
MVSISRQARSRSLSVFCLIACCVSLLSGCGGAGSNGGGGGGGGGTTSYTITVASANPASGVAITYGGTAVTTGTAAATLTESSGTTLTFSAPATAGNNNFSSWAGCTSVSAAQCTVMVSGNVTITANYVTPVAPAVTVTPASSSITVNQSLSVTVAVAASQGGSAPTGSVVLTSGTYTSSAATLSAGSATINIPANSLATGTASLKATYNPDSAAYVTSSGTASVTVNPPPAPTMSIGLSSSTITTLQPLTATVTVSGTPTPTGSVVLSGGGYTSAATTLNAGVAVITVTANSLAAGNDTLTATYTPDASSSSTYGSGTKTAAVTVTPVYTLTVNSTNPASGVNITATKDVNSSTGGNSPVSLVYAAGTNAVLTAPATSGSSTFSSWSGCNSTSGTPAVTCNFTVNANATLTANYTAPAMITLSPGSGNVTIGQSQQFTASVTGLSPATVTWSVAVASGTGSAGTITSAGYYQTPYPAPTSVTITATSTANTSITGSATVNLIAPPSTAGPALSVDAGTGIRAISPLIYGVNAYLLDAASAQNMNITVARWGGDATSRYNYQNADSNSAADYYFQNGGAYAMLTTNPNSLTSEANFNDFIAETTALGIKSIGTAPVLGYVSNNSTSACSFPKASYPNQTSYDSSNCGNGIQTQGTQMPDGTTCNTSGGCSIFGTSTTWQTTSVQEPPLPTPLPSAPNAAAWAQTTWTGQWVNCLVTTGANCTSAAGHDATIWDLDNEPAWWDAVHRDVHPSPSTYDEVTNGEVGTALAIKTIDPNALTSGPVIDNWWNYFYSKKDIESGWGTGPCYQPWSSPTDRTAHGGIPMIEYYLQQMNDASANYGVRLLDYLDIHAYVAASYNGSSVGLTTAGDTGEQQARMNSTRALWDSTYTDPNFPQPNYSANPGSQSCSVPLQAPMLIPMLQGWVAKDYPGTKIAIDEYNFGGTESINGAVTQADVLGIFGKYGLDMGVFWPTGAYSTQVPGNMAFEIYRNYDGNKSTFGDQELNSSTGDQSKLAVYAAYRTSDGALTIIVINKTYGSLTDTLSINSLSSPASSAQVYQYSSDNLNAIVAQPAATISAGSGSNPRTISTTFPAQSITLFVIPRH